jgi:hypothetical protein
MTRLPATRLASFVFAVLLTAATLASIDTLASVDASSGQLARAAAAASA